MSDQLPSEEEAIKILRQCGCSENVIKHCQVTASLAEEIASLCLKRGMQVNLQLVKVGALLHDVGRSKTHTVNHVVEGVAIAKRLHLPQPVVAIIAKHAGGGITEEEAEKLKWPPESYTPQTLEEKIVCYADKLVEGSRRILFEKTVRKFRRKHGENHPSIRNLKKLQRELEKLLGDLH